MKKIVLLCLLALSIKSQTTTQTVQITAVNPSHVCRDGEITLEFKFKYTGTFDTTYYNQFSFRYVSQNLTVWPIRTIKARDIFSLSKKLAGTDTIYYFTQNVDPQLSFGDYQVRVLPEATFTGKILKIMDCVGIKEYSPDKEQVIYYNLDGKMIEPVEKQLMIKQVGDRRSKVIIQ